MTDSFASSSSRAPVHEVQRRAEAEGMDSLAIAAHRQVLAGITTVEECGRVLR